MATLILFSGACNSGKTTTLKAVASKLRNTGYKVNILDELIRKEITEPIDEIRKNAKAYLLLQEKIIKAKIAQEKIAINDLHTDEIYLADRAATDSIFYLENYIDKSQLDADNLNKFRNLHKYVHDYLTRNFWRYSLVVEFEPIAVRELDLFRPVNVDILKEYEYTCISRLNYAYSKGNGSNRIKINLKKLSLNNAVELIIECAGL